MRINTLQNKILLSFVGLLVVLQIIGYFAIEKTIVTNAHHAIEQELKLSEKVFKKLLEQNAQKLIQAANLLAKDYGFLDAIHTQDGATIMSSLENHGKRIGADLTIMVGLDQKLTASNVNYIDAHLEKSVKALSQSVSKGGSASALTVFNKKPYQLVAVPVKAPVLIGWVMMAIPIAERTVEELHDITELEITILTQAKGQAWQMVVTSLPLAHKVVFEHQFKEWNQNNQSMMLEQENFGTRVLKLTQSEDHQALAVLQMSTDKLLAPYRQLQKNLLGLSFAATLIAIGLSALTARKISKPVQMLAQLAKRFAQGDYAGKIELKRNDEIGELAHSFMSMRDAIADREQAISNLAYHDNLTQLPNRIKFTSSLQQRLRETQAANLSCYILILDLNRFKHINDVLGHQTGDDVLRAISLRLLSILPNDQYLLARLGGDEFSILLPAQSADMARTDALQFAEMILKALDQPIVFKEQTIDLGASIGIATYPEDAREAISLMSRAEVAMYVAKARRNGVTEYVSAFDESNNQNLSLLSEMRSALDNEQFRLYVQPKMNLFTGEICAVEVLVRWLHPQRGFIFPDQFIPFAEHSGFIRQLSFWVMGQAAKHAHAWSEAGLNIKVSVNISTRDLMDQDLPEKFSALLKFYDVDATQFCLEITESAIMDDPQRALQTLNNLSAMSFELSIDDFGTGYSSLAYLKRLPVNELKIDKSFVLKMESEENDVKIVKSTIDLGHNMGLRVVAEGVETLALVKILNQLGCDQAQGYYLSKPFPASDFQKWLRAWVNPITQNASSKLSD